MAAMRYLFRTGLGLFLLSGLCVLGGVPATMPASATGLMATGSITSQPIGHYRFCRANPAACSVKESDRAPLEFTTAHWNDLVAVNLAVNKSVTPMSDFDIYGRDEVWAYPDRGVGDCEDYVLEKQRRLSRLGISLSDLLITVVRKTDGEGHAVLTVRTNRGDFILDNLTNQVKLWTDTNYRYLKRQASFDTGRWVTLRPGNNLLVSALKK